MRFTKGVVVVSHLHMGGLFKSLKKRGSGKGNAVHLEGKKKGSPSVEGHCQRNGSRRQASAFEIKIKIK
jgi:hypothetical protein